MANILICGLAGLAFGALAAHTFRSQHFALNLIGGAIICICTGLLLLPILGLTPAHYAIALLSMIIGSLATRLLLQPSQNPDAG